MIELIVAADAVEAPANPEDEAVVVPFPSARSKRRSTAPIRDFEEAIALARHGDNDAFAHLFRSLAPRIQQFARVRGAPHPDDLVNDVLLKIFTRLQQFDGNEVQFNAWVFRTVRNTLIDQARRRAVRPVETLVDLTPQMPSADDPEMTAIGNLAQQTLEEHLGVLTAEQRDVVLLRVVADLSIASIAEIIGKSPGATKALQRRAFAALADHLRDGERQND